MDTNNKKNILKISGLSKSFLAEGSDQTTMALHNINLEMHSGEFISIVGPSGCGKSTILRLIAGLIVPTLGSISLNGKEVTGPSPNRGMAFQKPTLFDWLTVKENVSFSLKLQNKLAGHEKEVDRLLELVDLAAFADFYPRQLSGGMAQRVALIRTMINDPEVFLLDEPLGALDAFTRMHMQDELTNMWMKKKPIMIMVTHDVDEAIYMGTRVLVMNPRPGRIHDDIAIDLEYPRNRTSETFVMHRNNIMEMLDFGKAE